MAIKKTFSKNDKDLYDVLMQATYEERQEFIELLRKKLSCDLPEDPEVWQLAAEFQLMGGHTFANIKRGHGVTYNEILSDVGKCVLKKTAKEEFKTTQTVEQKENIILQFILEKAIGKMTPEQRDDFEKEVQNEAEKRGYKKSTVSGFKSPAALLAVQGMRVVIAKLVAQAVLKKAGVKVLTKIGGKWVAILAGPVAVAIAVIWTAVDFAGPAYSTTVPGVMLITAMRARQKSEDVIEQLHRAGMAADQKVEEVIYG